MRLVLEPLPLGASRRIRLDTKAVVGVGGQATVYRHDDLAVKVYHPIDPRAPQRVRDLEAQLRSSLIDKMQHFPVNLPDQVVGPRAIVRDGRGRALGYAMPLVAQGVEIAALSRRRHRQGVVSNSKVMRIFHALYRVLEALHAAGVVVGDLNDGNVLVVGETVRLIDVDSMQFGSFACPVAHERFLDPQLYGVDLTASPKFSPDNDWFSFAVLLFSALLYVHPFGGVHPKLATFLRRAEAGVSLLSKLVKRPKAAADPKTLPVELFEAFRAIFEGGVRQAIDPTLFDVPWVRCGCGVEHARTTCPACRSVGVVRPTATHHGSCRVTPIFSTIGRIVAVTVDGRGARPIEWVAEISGQLVRDDGTVLGEAPTASLDTSYGLSGSTLWIGRGDRLVRVDGDDKSVAATSTFAGRSAFAVGPDGAVTVTDDWLVAEERGARIGPVLSGTTWIAAGQTLGFGFYRARDLTKYFVFRPSRAGLTYVELPPIRGRVRTVHAAFDETMIVFSIVTDEGGAVVSRLFIVGADGQVLGRLEGPLDSNRVLAAPRGRCVYGGHVVTATEDGLVALTIDGGRVREHTHFVDTEPFVSAETEILCAAGGGVYAVTTTAITSLALT